MPSCVSTKGGEAMPQRFFVIGCDGSQPVSAATLKEAEAVAEKRQCSIVLKVLRLCGGAEVKNVNELIAGIAKGEIVPVPEADEDEED